jgi:acyl dehydratase
MVAIDLAALPDRVGQEIAISPWLEITQERVDRFAEATGDHQWIHVDPARAATDSPYKTTIAHGFLTLSLVSVMARSAMSFEQTRMAINYGANRVRFPSAVPVGSRIRGRFAAAKIERQSDSIQVTWTVTIERDGAPKPAGVVEWIVRYYVDTVQAAPRASDVVPM